MNVPSWKSEAKSISHHCLTSQVKLLNGFQGILIHCVQSKHLTYLYFFSWVMPYFGSSNSNRGVKCDLLEIEDLHRCSSQDEAAELCHLFEKFDFYYLV